MIHAWYESRRDGRDHIYFEKTEITTRREPLTPYPHFHHSIELAVGLRGAIPISVGKERIILEPGDVCFINSLEPHKYFYSVGDACYVTLISSSFFTEVNHLGNVSYPTHVKCGEGSRVLCRFLDFANDTWDESSLICKRAFADQLAYLLYKYVTPIPKREVAKQDAMLLGAVQYICEHYTERLTVSEVAHRFGYSANYFSTAFNAFMGASFPDYLNACRVIEYSRIHRENPKLPACKIAKMCGFGSMNTFYRARAMVEAQSITEKGGEKP